MSLKYKKFIFFGINKTNIPYYSLSNPNGFPTKWKVMNLSGLNFWWWNINKGIVNNPVGIKIGA